MIRFLEKINVSLPEFINSNLERILSEWVAFARTRRPAAEDMGAQELRNAAGALLRAIAEAIVTAEGGKGRHQASAGGEEGEGVGQAPSVATEAEVHACQRFSEGFTLDQMVSEYHALRASVVRLWREQLSAVDGDTLSELTRFNEAIDRALAQSIQRYTSKLEQARDLFLGVLGHDLRNPLGAILMSSQFLLLSGVLESEYLTAAVRIRNSGHRMQQMIEDLLDFTRARLGPGLLISPAPMDLTALCREAINESEALYPGYTLKLNHSGNLSGTWDGARIAQMLSNLIANAIQHCRQDTPVTLTAQDHTDEVLLCVHNEGTPIPPAVQRTIFDPLMRARGSEARRHARSDGLGLGLHIARKIAEAHGGSIEVRSSKEQGTTFEVRLPRHANPSSAVSGLT